MKDELDRRYRVRLGCHDCDEVPGAGCLDEVRYFDTLEEAVADAEATTGDTAPLYYDIVDQATDEAVPDAEITKAWLAQPRLSQ